MPITSSAKKALRVSVRKRKHNDRRKNAMRAVIKDVKKTIAGKNKEEARALLPQMYKAIDKAAKRGVIKKNTAARKKSRLSRLAHKIG